MTIPIQIDSNHIRHLPNEFYIEPACSIMCHLDGVSDQNDSIPSDITAQCITLLSENEYDVTVNDYHRKTGGKIILSIDGRIINDQIQQLLLPNVSSFPCSGADPGGGVAAPSFKTNVHFFLLQMNVFASLPCPNCTAPLHCPC